MPLLLILQTGGIENTKNRSRLTAIRMIAPANVTYLSFVLLRLPLIFGGLEVLDVLHNPLAYAFVQPMARKAFETLVVECYRLQRAQN